MPSARMFSRTWLLTCIGVLAAAGACSSGKSNGSTGSTSSSSQGTSSTAHTATTTASGTGGAGSTGHGGGGNGGAAQSATASGTGGAGSTGHGGNGTGGAAQSATASSSSTASGTGGAACAPEVHAAAGLPVDMFLMQDQSGSMADTVSGGGTKWDAVTSAIDAFAQQSLSGVSIGIQYFALTSGATCTVTHCTKDSDCGPATCGPCDLTIPGVGFCTGVTGGDSCTVADYTNADVEIAPIPSVASAMSTSLAAHVPSTSTPTAPALQGAVNHAQAWATSHPGHIVVAVFSTDGEPSECSPIDQTSIAQIAATALAGTPSIKTFTLGTFAPADIPSGPSLLDAIAAAGGTGQGFDIGVATTSDASQSVLSALNQIRLQALGCQYPIPPTNAGPNPNPADVDVQYTPSGGSSAIIPQVQDAAHCPASGDAWYYDSPSAPSFILLCASTCTKVDADPAGSLEFLLGCPTVTAP